MMIIKNIIIIALLRIVKPSEAFIFFLTLLLLCNNKTEDCVSWCVETISFFDCDNKPHRHLFGGTEENHEPPVMVAGISPNAKPSLFRVANLHRHLQKNVTNTFCWFKIVFAIAAEDLDMKSQENPMKMDVWKDERWYEKTTTTSGLPILITIGTVETATQIYVKRFQ
jgi:hypothetical protein